MAADRSAGGAVGAASLSKGANHARFQLGDRISRVIEPGCREICLSVESLAFLGLGPVSIAVVAVSLYSAFYKYEVYLPTG